MIKFKSLLSLANDSKARMFLFNTQADFKQAGIDCEDKPTFDELLSEFDLTITGGYKVARNGHMLNARFEMIIDRGQIAADINILEDRYEAHPIAVYLKLVALYRG